MRSCETKVVNGDVSAGWLQRAWFPRLSLPQGLRSPFRACASTFSCARALVLVASLCSANHHYHSARMTALRRLMTEYKQLTSFGTLSFRILQERRLMNAYVHPLSLDRHRRRSGAPEGLFTAGKPPESEADLFRNRTKIDICLVVAMWRLARPHQRSTSAQTT